MHGVGCHRILDSGTRGVISNFGGVFFPTRMGPKVTSYKWSYRVPLNKWPKKTSGFPGVNFSPIEVKLCCVTFYFFLKLNQSINQPKSKD